MENETPTTPKKGISPILIGLIIVILVVGGAAGYTMMQKQQAQHEMSEDEQMEGMEPSEDAMSPSTAPTDAVMEGQNVEQGNVKTIEISGSNFKYAPNSVKVKEGDTVRIVFKNTGGFHDFVIDELNVKTKQLADGASETVEFVASKKGTFKYYCSVGKHREMGMEGTLVVN